MGMTFTKMTFKTNRRGTLLLLALCTLFFTVGATQHDHPPLGSPATEVSLDVAPGIGQGACPACRGSREQATGIVHPTEVEAPAFETARAVATQNASPDRPVLAGRPTRGPPPSSEA